MRIRTGGLADAPAILAMLDGAVAWMNARGNTEQWGTTPYSQQPGGVARVEGYTTENSTYIAELDGGPVGAMVVGSGPNPWMPIAPAGEPECYVRLLISDRRYAGRGIGAALLVHAESEARRAGVALLRVDCWAGGGGELVAYYERQGFTPTESFQVKAWPDRCWSDESVTSITVMDYEHVVVTFTTDSKQLANSMAAEVACTEFSCCAHIEGPIRRVHRWHGRQHTSEQWRVEIEATPEGAGPLVDHITSHHAGEVHDLVVTDNVRHLVAD